MEYEKRSSAQSNSRASNCSIEEFNNLQRHCDRLSEENKSLMSENKKLSSSNGSYIEMTNKLHAQYIKTQNQLRSIIMIMAEANPVRDSLNISKILSVLVRPDPDSIGALSGLSNEGLFSQEDSSAAGGASDIFMCGGNSNNRSTPNLRANSLMKKDENSFRGFGESQNERIARIAKKQPQEEEANAARLMEDLLKKSKKGKIDERLFQEVLKRVNGFEKRRLSGSPVPSVSLQKDRNASREKPLDFSRANKQNEETESSSTVKTGKEKSRKMSPTPPKAQSFRNNSREQLQPQPRPNQSTSKPKGIPSSQNHNSTPLRLEYSQSSLFFTFF